MIEDDIEVIRRKEFNDLRSMKTNLWTKNAAIVLNFLSKRSLIASTPSKKITSIYHRILEDYMDVSKWPSNSAMFIMRNRETSNAFTMNQFKFVLSYEGEVIANSSVYSLIAPKNTYVPQGVRAAQCHQVIEKMKAVIGRYMKKAWSELSKDGKIYIFPRAIEEAKYYMEAYTKTGDADSICFTENEWNALALALIGKKPEEVKAVVGEAAYEKMVGKPIGPVESTAVSIIEDEIENLSKKIGEDIDKLKEVYKSKIDKLAEERQMKIDAMITKWNSDKEALKKKEEQILQGLLSMNEA